MVVSVKARTIRSVEELRLWCLALFTLSQNRKEGPSMTKNLESMTEVIRNPKHSFRKTFDQAKKQLRHRHERRKIREILHMSELIEEEMV
jgi:hypothetical protein